METHDDVGEMIDCEIEKASGLANNPPGASKGLKQAQQRKSFPNQTNGNSFASLSRMGDHATDQLEKCGKWLASIPRDDINVLRQTVEYQEFLRAFERLGQAHFRVVVNNQVTVATETKQEEEEEQQQPPNKQHRSVAGFRGSAKRNAGVFPSENNKNSNNDNSGVISRKYSSKFDICNGSNAKNHSPQDAFPRRETAPTVSMHEGGESQTTTIDHSSTSTSNGSNKTFLRFTDDILLRILEFLRCRCLIQTSLTCSRFHQLAIKSATQRTYDIATARQLGNVMQLLRAKEQIYYVDSGAGSADGNPHADEETTNGGGDDETEIDTEMSNEQDARTSSSSNKNNISSGIGFSVPVPTLLPGRRVLVTNSGDPDYNGVYYCTDCDGNGFVFTKPRFSSHQQSQRISPQQREHELARIGLADEDINNNPPRHQNNVNIRIVVRRANPGNNNDNNINNEFVIPPIHRPLLRPNVRPNIPLETQLRMQQRQQQRRRLERSEEESFQSGLPLRCVIAKAYSNHDLIWYMSKEIETPMDGASNSNGISRTQRTRMFSFYAPLMLSGNAPPELCLYPSQTSALLRQNHTWRSLRPETTNGMEGPTLEVIDTESFHL